MSVKGVLSLPSLAAACFIFLSPQHLCISGGHSVLFDFDGTRLDQTWLSVHLHWHRPINPDGDFLAL